MSVAKKRFTIKDEADSKQHSTLFASVKVIFFILFFITLMFLLVRLMFFVVIFSKLKLFYPVKNTILMGWSVP